jgi:hypothetical protein
MADPRRFPFAEDWSTDRGVLHLERPTAGIVTTRVEGFAAVELGVRIMAWVNAALDDDETPTVFHDWELATGYEPALRPRFTAWYLRVRSRVAGVHVLTKSKLVAMGVSLVSLATGNDIVGYRERPPFTKALDATLLAARVSNRGGTGTRS